MTIHIENLGGGGSGPAFPPKFDPTFTAPQLPVLVHIWNPPQTTIGSGWRMDYIGSDAINLGMLLTLDGTYNALRFTPSGVNPPPAGFFQSGILLTPLQLAWFSQMKSRHFSEMTLRQGLSLTQAGSAAASALCCLSGGANSGQCYALSAAAQGEAPRTHLNLAIEYWQFPNVPNIGTAQAPNTELEIDTLLTCGQVVNGDRIQFEAIDLGTSWRLTAYVNAGRFPSDFQGFRGTVTDSRIGAGQPGLAVVTYSGVQPIEIGDFAGGWGPSDVPFPIP